MISQVVFLGFVCLATASVIPYGVPAYGDQIIARPQPYSTAYNVVDEYGTTLSRQEVGDELGNKRGSYGYIDAHGISRQVDYVADELGFRAVVRTNEPGTENQNPADVQIESSAGPVPYGSSGLPSGVRPALGPLYGQAGLVQGVAPVGRLPPQALSPGLGPVASLY